MDDIKEMLLAGMNIIRINMAYCNSKVMIMINRKGNRRIVVINHLF